MGSLKYIVTIPITMSENLEEHLLEQLKYKSGLDREKLSELITLATKLFDRVQNQEAKSANMRVFKRWWIRGIPAPDGIGFEVIVTREQISELINVIDELSEVRNVINTLEVTPGLVSGPAPPHPWKVTGSLGADPDPHPWRDPNPHPW